MLIYPENIYPKLTIVRNFDFLKRRINKIFQPINFSFFKLSIKTKDIIRSKEVSFQFLSNYTTFNILKFLKYHNLLGNIWAGI